MTEAVSLDEILELTKQLSLLDKVRLIEEIAPQIKRELNAAQVGQRTPLRGLWKGLDITEEDIAEARADMWDNFPRKDV
jgi:predicted phage-related endonuclease